MREKLNSNPLVQAAVIGVLLIGTAFFMLSSSGGGEGEEAGTPETTVGVTDSATGEAVEGTLDATATGTAVPELPPAAALAAPPLPRPVSRAYASNQTLVLLFVRNGGIDDRLVEAASAGVRDLPGVSLFVVPARRISRYAAITEGVGVERVPALVVVSPKHLDKTVPTASVSYGFQPRQSVVQAIVDAGYEGPTVDYHP